MFNNRCISSVFFQIFFHITHDHRPFAGYYINSARTLLLAAEVRCVFFSSTLFPAHTFLILILQTASYKTHACGVWLTLISGGCGVLRSTRVLHTKLKRPGTRSNRLGPDPDPDDHLKYRPEPVRIPGPRVSGPPWRPLEYTVDERAQRTATSENTCKSRKHLHQFDSRSCKCSQHKQRNALQILITQPNKEFYLQCVYLFGCVVSICSVFLYLVVVGAFAAHVLSNWWRCFLNLQVFFLFAVRWAFSATIWIRVWLLHIFVYIMLQIIKQSGISEIWQNTSQTRHFTHKKTKHETIYCLNTFWLWNDSEACS